MTDEYELVVSTLASIFEDDATSENRTDGAVQDVLKISADEAIELLTAVAESADSDYVYHPAVVGFTVGLKLGERIGYGRGMNALA